MCETMQIAVNSVINLSFFLLYLLFFYISKWFYRFWKWREICTELRIRRLDTWRHRARDHSTGHRPLPTYWWSFGTKPVSPAVLEILASKSIGVKTLTFQRHVTSSVTWPIHFRYNGHQTYRRHDLDLSGHVTSTVTWPFDYQVAISYRHSIVTKSLSPAISEIIGTKHIGVMTLTFQGHVTSSVTWPFNSQGAISYRLSIVTKLLTPAIFEKMRTKHIGVMTLTFQGHVTLSVTWPFHSQLPISYRHSIVTKSLSPAVSQIMGIK